MLQVPKRITILQPYNDFYPDEALQILGPKTDIRITSSPAEIQQLYSQVHQH